MHIHRTTDIPGQLGERNQKENLNGMEQVQDCGVYTGRHTPETRDGERRPGILRISGPIVRHPNMVAHGEGKENAPNMSSEKGMVNTACCIERQSNEC